MVRELITAAMLGLNLGTALAGLTTGNDALLSSAIIVGAYIVSKAWQNV